MDYRKMLILLACNLPVWAGPDVKLPGQAYPELSLALIPAYWQLEQSYEVKQSGQLTCVTLWPKAGAGITWKMTGKVQVELRFEQYHDLLIAAVYLRHHGKGDFVFLRTGRDNQLPLFSWPVSPLRWLRFTLSWAASDEGVRLTGQCGDKSEQVTFPQAELLDITDLGLPEGLKVARIGFTADPSPLYPVEVH